MMPDGFECFVAIDARHVDVANDQVRQILLRDLDSCLPVFGGQGFEAVDIQRLTDNHPDLLRVINHQHSFLLFVERVIG